MFRIHGADIHQQRCIRQVQALGDSPVSRPVLMIAGYSLSCRRKVPFRKALPVILTMIGGVKPVKVWPVRVHVLISR